jgi:hypothetical protein
LTEYLRNTLNTTENNWIWKTVPKTNIQNSYGKNLFSKIYPVSKKSLSIKSW